MVSRLLASIVVGVFALACASGRRDAKPLRVMSYNIHAGKDAAGQPNLERVAALIKAQRADIVLLQEVDRNTRRSGNVDQLAVLMDLTAMHGAFGKSLDYDGGEYGIAVLSRRPVTEREIVPLRVDPPQKRSGGSIEPRIAFFVRTGGVGVVNTHLDASREETYRLQEIAELLRFDTAREPDVVGGDFNAEPGSAPHAAALAAGLRDAWAECGRGEALTYPDGTPVKRIDYLFLTGAARCDEARVLDSRASDHRPVLVRVRLGKGS